MTTPRHRPTTPDPRASEDGQILVLTVVVALALLAILGLVADGGLILARHRELQGIADAAARAGAAQLDEASYRPATAAPPPSTPPRLRPQPGDTCERSGSADRPTSPPPPTKSRSNYLRWFVL
jgi:hypothetical protein